MTSHRLHRQGVEGGRWGWINTGTRTGLHSPLSEDGVSENVPHPPLKPRAEVSPEERKDFPSGKQTLTSWLFRHQAAVANISKRNSVAIRWGFLLLCFGRKENCRKSLAAHALELGGSGDYAKGSNCEQCLGAHGGGKAAWSLHQTGSWIWRPWGPWEKTRRSAQGRSPTRCCGLTPTKQL